MVGRLALALFALALVVGWVCLLYVSARVGAAPMTVGAALVGVMATVVGQRIARWW